MYEAWILWWKWQNFEKCHCFYCQWAKNIGEIVGIFQIATQIICIAVPNEGKRRNFDNGQSICQYFSILLGIFGNFENIPTCSSQYWYWVMPISKFPKLLFVKKLENQICVNFLPNIKAEYDNYIHICMWQ